MDTPFRPQFVPRPGNARGRPLVLFDATDATRYHTAVLPVARRIDGALGARVVADRLACGSLPPHGHGWLMPWRPALDRLRSRSRAMLEDGRTTVLRTDVADCYPSIRPDIVEPALVAGGAHPAEAGKVGSVLESMEAAGVAGLPVGPAASSVLANAVLARADRCLEGLQFLRWVDDYFVFARTDREAQAARRSLEAGLAELGLSLSAEKTRIGGPDVAGISGCSGVGLAPALQSLPT